MLSIIFILLLFPNSQEDFQIKYGDLNYMKCDSLKCDLKERLSDGKYEVYDLFKGHKYLRIKGEIKNNKRVGIWNYWNSYEKIGYYPNSVKDSIELTLGDNVSIGTLNDCKNQGCDTTFLDLVKNYNSEGELINEISYSEGDKFSEDVFENEKKIKTIHWGTNSTPLFTIDYKSSHLLFKGYYESGELKEQGKTNFDNIQFGKWTFYHKNGEKYEEGFYKKIYDIKINNVYKWKFWNDKGELIKIEKYKNRN